MIDMISFFEKMVNTLEMGQLIGQPSQLSGGCVHEVYKVITDKGEYVIKVLNPYYITRQKAMRMLDRNHKFSLILQKNDIEAVYELKFNGEMLQQQDGKYFYVYPFYDGKMLRTHEITGDKCSKIAEVLSRIHKITVTQQDIKEVWNISNINQKAYDYLNINDIDFKWNKLYVNWENYVQLAKDTNSPIYPILYDNLEMLTSNTIKGNEAIDKLPSDIAICHNDLDIKNVLWINDRFKIIDLETLAYGSPYIELLKTALAWTGYEECNIKFNLFKSFMTAYFKGSKLKRSVDWENIYYAHIDGLQWLEYNVKRALTLGINSKDQLLGTKYVKQAMDRVVYYNSVKSEIIKICEEL